MTEKKNNTECKQSKVVSNFYEMKYPNEAIIVYNGKFSVSTGNSSIELDGTIYFGWYPQKGLRFEGINLKNDEQNLRKNFIISFSPIQTLLIDNQVVGHCITESCNDIDYKFKGRFINTAIKGDKTIPVEKITFALLNLKSLNGEQQEGDENTHKERITLESKDFEINIYKVPNFKSASDELKQKGGYQILYNGEIVNKNKKSNFSYEESVEIIRRLGIFLSFINGLKINPLFVTGQTNNEINWTDFSANIIEPFKEQCWNNWTPLDFSIEIKELWNEFEKIWIESKDNQFFLEFIVQWYIEANTSKGLIEGSIIMTQTALEALYNWFVIEHGNLIVGRDAIDISASNKIRLLLSQIEKKDKSIPSHYIALSKFKTDISDDAPEKIVQIRNAIIHANKDKMVKLSNIDIIAKYEALQLALEYVELSILYILKYKGRYRMRSSANSINQDCILPWM